MKQVIGMLVLLLGMSTALAVETTTLSRPTITFEYDETVGLLGVIFTASTTGQTMPYLQNPQTTSSTTYSFQPVNHLINGPYQIFLRVNDSIGNERTNAYEFIVDRPFPAIELLQPANGYSTTPIFDLVIGTSAPLECKYAVNPAITYDMIALPENSFTTFDGLTHTITGFDDLKDLSDNQIYTIYVKCKDDFGITNDNDPERFDLFIDRTAPSIQAWADPYLVIEFPETTIYVQSDDPVLCRYTAEPTNYSSMNEMETSSAGVYGLEHHQRITNLQDQNTYTYSAQCINQAGQLSNIADVQFVTDLSTLPAIIRALPSGFTGPNVWLNVTTNKNARCTYDGTQFYQSANQYGKNHLAQKTDLAEGMQEYAIQCQFELGGTASTTIVFTVDKTGPTNFTINASDTCSDNEMRFSYTGNDPSGIAGVAYTITGPQNLKVAEGIATSSPVVVNADLRSGASYVINASAIDGAGNRGAMKVAQPIFARNESSKECDVTPPGTLSTVRYANQTAFVNITCQDSQSGCTPSYQYALVNTSQACTPDTTKQYGTTLTATKPGKLCWTAQDLAGNKAQGNRLIDFSGANQSAGTCANGIKDNDETGIDCGGPCQICTADQTCTLNSDCSSGLCLNGICQQSSCSDGAKNGLETDVDCGGGTCSPCADAKTCVYPADCQSNDCVDQVCQPASCTDGVKNGQETDIDCGGNTCPACVLGNVCRINTDCTTQFCQAGRCQERETPALIILEEGTSMLFWILLIAGLVCLLGGGGYIGYTTFMQKETPRVVSQHGMNPNIGNARSREPVAARGSPAMPQNPLARALYRSRAQTKQASRKELMQSFLETSGQATEKKPSSLRTQPALQKSIDQPEGFITLDELHQRVNPAQYKNPLNTGKDVWQELEDIVKPVEENVRARTSEQTKPKQSQTAARQEEQTSTNELAATPEERKPMTNTQIFEELAKMASASKTEIKQTLSGSMPTKTNAKKIFATVEKREDLDMDVFEAILTSLLGKGKLSKQTVSEILFEFKDRKLLTASEVAGLRRQLKLE